MLHYESREEEEVIKLNSETPNHSVSQNIIGKFRNWIIMYLILAGLVLPYQFFLRNEFRYPLMLKESSIILVVLTTILPYATGTTHTKTFNPEGIKVDTETMLNDINTAPRDFNVFGPFIGYVLAAILYSFYILESRY